MEPGLQRQPETLFDVTENKHYVTSYNLFHNPSQSAISSRENFGLQLAETVTMRVKSWLRWRRKCQRIS